MLLDSLLKIVQIAFYVTGASVAVATYLAARRGLLNTVNTEYHKKVIERLFEASKEIYEEFDLDSDKNWTKIEDVKGLVQQLNQDLLNSRHEFLTSDREDFFGGFPVSPMEMRLLALEKKYQSDPFIPRSIRSILIDFFQKRQTAIANANEHAVTAYRKHMKQNKDWSSIQDNWLWVHNIVNQDLYNAGFGVSQVEDKINFIRSEIQRYFEGFNPLAKSFSQLTLGKIILRHRRLK